MELKIIIASVFWYSGMVTLFVLVPMVFVLAEFCPKSLIKRFMRPPHYPIADCYAYSMYPMKIFRGIAFAGAVAWPILGRYRKLTNARQYAPKWWKVLSFIYCWLFFLPSFLGLLLSGIYVAVFF